MTITAEWLASSCAHETTEVEVSRLEITAGPDRGVTHEIARSPFVVGTSEAADVRLSDPSVSRLHCELTRAGSKHRVVDLGSRNGAWAGTVRLHDGEVAEGTHLRLGNTTLVVQPAFFRLPRTVWRAGDSFGPLVGRSRVMQELFALLARIGASREPVLVRGETGTGKELVARALHDALDRPRAPFVVVDGGALARSLAEAELFGHAKGAFTGAGSDREGAFERASGGTLFLDEIGDVPIEVQPKLLRALEDGTVQRLGEGQRRKVSVRVVAATHRPLHRMVNEGSFREDLYYRLSVLEVTLPPLRDRTGDVELLASRFLDEIAPSDAELRGRLLAAMSQAATYRWPGNVRELRNFVRRFALLGGVPLPQGADGGALEDARTDLSFHDAKRHVVEAFERRYLRRLLDECGGSVKDSAARAGLSRPHLSELLGRLGMRAR